MAANHLISNKTAWKNWANTLWTLKGNTSKSKCKS